MDLLAEVLRVDLFTLGLPLVGMFGSHFAIDALAQKATRNFLGHIRLLAVIVLLNHILVAIILHHRIPPPFLFEHTIHLTNFEHIIHPTVVKHILHPFPLHQCHLQNTINPSATGHLEQHQFTVTLLMTPFPSLLHNRPLQTYHLGFLKPKMMTLTLKVYLPVHL